MGQDTNDLQKKFKEILNKLPEDKKKALYSRLKEMDSEERNKTIAAIVAKDSEVHGAEHKEAAEAKTAPAPAPANKPQQNKHRQNPKGQKPAPKQGQKPAPKQNHNQKPAPKQGQKPAQKAAQKPVQKPAQKPVQNKKPQKPENKQINKPAPKEESPFVVQEAPKQTPKETKKSSGSPFKVMLVFTIVLAVGILGFVGYMKRDAIMKLFNPSSAETEVAATTATSETSASQGETEPSVTETSDVPETSESEPVETSDTEGSDMSDISDTSDTPEPTEVSWTPTPAVTPTPVPAAPGAPHLSGMVIVLDPGHQKTTNEQTEKVASWLAAEKSRCTSGGKGVATGIPEYELTLQLGMLFKEYLEKCGATVIMTRTTNDIDLSNQERANMATAANCNLYLRIHADSANDSKTSGIQMYVPNHGNNFKADMIKARVLGDNLCNVTGLPFNGVLSTEVYTGLNYATNIHSIQVSFGYLSNSDDEAILTNEQMQYNMAVAVAQLCAEYK